MPTVSKSYTHTKDHDHVNLGSDDVTVSIINGKQWRGKGTQSKGELVRDELTGPAGAVIGSNITHQLLSDTSTSYSSTAKAKAHLHRGVTTYREKYLKNSGDRLELLVRAANRQQEFCAEKCKTTQSAEEMSLPHNSEGPPRSVYQQSYCARLELLKEFTINDAGRAKVDPQRRDYLEHSLRFFQPAAVHVSGRANTRPTQQHIAYEGESVLEPSSLDPFKRKPLVWREHLRKECRFPVAPRKVEPSAQTEDALQHEQPHPPPPLETTQGGPAPSPSPPSPSPPPPEPQQDQPTAPPTPHGVRPMSAKRQTSRPLSARPMQRPSSARRPGSARQSLSSREGAQRGERGQHHYQQHTPDHEHDWWVPPAPHNAASRPPPKARYYKTTYEKSRPVGRRLVVEPQYANKVRDIYPAMVECIGPS